MTLPTDRYLYVEAREYQDDPDQGLLTFDSAQVDAQSETEAYQLGPARLQMQQQDTPGPLTASHLTARLKNDYVVRL